MERISLVIWILDRDEMSSIVLYVMSYWCFYTNVV